MSQLTNISVYKSIQSITEIRRHEINDSTQKPGYKLYKIDTQQRGYCCVLHVPEMNYGISFQSVGPRFQELNLHQASQYQCYTTCPTPGGQTLPLVSLLALAHRAVTRGSCLSLPTCAFVTLALCTHILNESSQCTLGLLKGNDRQLLAVGSLLAFTLLITSVFAPSKICNTDYYKNHWLFHWKYKALSALSSKCCMEIRQSRCRIRSPTGGQSRCRRLRGLALFPAAPNTALGYSPTLCRDSGHRFSKTLCHSTQNTSLVWGSRGRALWG